MSPIKQLSTSVRDLLFNLRSLAKPTIWVPLGVLCLGGMFIWEVAVHPDWLDGEEEGVAASIKTDPNATLSAEDSAIAAEIDTVPVLVEQLNRSQFDPTTLGTPALSTQGFFDEIRTKGLPEPQPSNPVSSGSVSLPPLSQPDLLVLPTTIGNQNANVGVAGGFTSFPTVGLLGEVKPSVDLGSAAVPASTNPYSATANPSAENAAVTSPLQAAMQQYLELNPAPATPAPQPSNNASEPASAASVTAQPAAEVSNAVPAGLEGQITGYTYTPLPNPTQTPQAPVALPPTNPYQTSFPNPGFDPGLQPTSLPAVTSFPASPTPLNLSPSPLPSPAAETPQMNSGFPSNAAGNPDFRPIQPIGPDFGSGAVQVKQDSQPLAPASNQPFTAPRPVPGQYIGGGEINTFGNP